MRNAEYNRKTICLASIPHSAFRIPHYLPPPVITMSPFLRFRNLATTGHFTLNRKKMRSSPSPRERLVIRLAFADDEVRRAVLVPEARRTRFEQRADAVVAVVDDVRRIRADPPRGHRPSSRR